MAAWPSTLPAPLAGSLNEQRLPNVVRSDMDIGPDKLRRRSTADIVRLDFALLLTDAQASTLETFYVTTLGAGVLSFTWTHPRTGAAINARFTTPPSLAHQSKGLWRTAIALEILP